MRGQTFIGDVVVSARAKNSLVVEAREGELDKVS